MSTLNMSFDTLKECYDWSNKIIGTGLQVQLSRICEDRFKSCRPRGKNSRIFQVLGTTWGMEKKCRDIEPDGKFRVEIEPPGTEYEKAGILDMVQCKTTVLRMSVWYSRFLPYAVAMMESENGFEQAAVDFTSINAYYGTCLGFCDLGLGDGHSPADKHRPEYNRIEKQDVDLFEEIYYASMDLMSPSLPFSQSFNPCVVYVAIHDPQRVLKFFSEGHELIDHVREVCEKIGKPIPAGFELSVA